MSVHTHTHTHQVSSQDPERARNRKLKVEYLEEPVGPRALVYVVTSAQ